MEQRRVNQVESEDPSSEQWRMLSAYAYPPNVERYLTERFRRKPTTHDVEFACGCFRQAREFWAAAETAPLDIAPIIAYYAATALFGGAATLIKGRRPEIESHGMVMTADRRRQRIGARSVTTQGRAHCALRVYSAVFGTGAPQGGQNWKLKEIMGSIPDLSSDFLRCYPNAKLFFLPVQVIHSEDGVADRIKKSDIARVGPTKTVMDRIEGRRDSYLEPQHLPEHVLLRHRLDGRECGEYTVYGQKYIPIPHHKQGKSFTLTQPIAYLMALFALGHLARYYPEVWNVFVRSDQTGERLVVERLLTLAARQIPNLMLDAIHEEAIIFIRSGSST